MKETITPHMFDNEGAGRVVETRGKGDFSQQPISLVEGLRKRENYVGASSVDSGKRPQPNGKERRARAEDKKLRINQSREGRCGSAETSSKKNEKKGRKAIPLS